MGFFDTLLRLFGLRSPRVRRGARASRIAVRRRPKAVLRPLRRQTPKRERPPPIRTAERPYAFAHFHSRRDGFLDFSRDGTPGRLAQFSLPVFRTPAELAAWLGLPIGKVVWLTHRFSHKYRPDDEKHAHYHFHWMKKRTGGWRLIESPKPMLKQVQTRILRELLFHVPEHPSVHGFRAGRSIVTNARPHAGHRVVVKLDLEQFYATVTYSRVTAIFRSLGYSREAAIWLARLATSALPPTMYFPQGDSSAILPFLRLHLPQGAPTSPALASLSAFGLDVRLSGLARSFGANYTRYADDLTFSGPERFLRSLRIFLPLCGRIIRSERFRLNPSKRRVLRDNQRQSVTGVVVNERPNVSRAEFDRLKAILTNCVGHGPGSQNRENVENYSAHLRGRVAHVQQLNPARGAKLLEIYHRIDWRSVENAGG